MAANDYWPFERLFIDHLFHGATRVWWRLVDTFNDTPPYVFQLQAGYTGNNNALDWENVGDPGNNAFFLDDHTSREESGKRLLTHYRIVLTSARNTYISVAQGIYGNLTEKDWRLSREILRKEQLRLSIVSQEGYLIKRMRYGNLNPANTDPLTREIIDSSVMSSWGTAFKIGYHPAVRFDVDFDPADIRERKGGADVMQTDTRPTAVNGRIIGFPDISKDDVWVHGTTDQRWSIDDIMTVTAIRGIPIVYTVKFNLIPYSDVVYKIPVSYLSTDLAIEQPFQAVSGRGCVHVDHNFGSVGNLTYEDNCCVGIAGATVSAFKKVDWDADHRSPSDAIAIIQTTTNGHWAMAMKLDPGQYVLRFEKPGEYGPNTTELTIAAAAPIPPPRPNLAAFTIGGPLPNPYDDEFGR